MPFFGKLGAKLAGLKGSGVFGKLIENAEGILDEIITTDEEREKAKLELTKVLVEAEREAFKNEVRDRESARDLYKSDAFIQKALSILFTAAYFGLTYVMFRFFVMGNIDLSDYEIGFLSSAFGAMSAKVNTIVDFFFGGSSEKNKAHQQIQYNGKRNKEEL